MAAPGPARTLALLRRIHDRHGPQGFGRVAQTLLALSFQSKGFRVTKNPVGVPDILAHRPNPAGGFAIEVKTSEQGRITLEDRELKALLDSGLTPTLAVLSFPAQNPEWYFVAAESLPTGVYDLVHLARRPRSDVGFDANLAFRTILADHLAMIMDNLEGLDSLLSSHDY